MKKLFALMMVTGFAVAFVACGGKKAVDTEKLKADSIAKADSVAKVEAEATAVKAKADSAAKADSVKAASEKKK